MGDKIKQALEGLEELIGNVKELRDCVEKQIDEENCCMQAKETKNHGYAWKTSLVFIKDEDGDGAFGLKFKNNNDSLINLYYFAPEEMGNFIAFLSSHLALLLKNSRITTVK